MIIVVLLVGHETYSHLLSFGDIRMTISLQAYRLSVKLSTKLNPNYRLVYPILIYSSIPAVKIGEIAKEVAKSIGCQISLVAFFVHVDKKC